MCNRNAQIDSSSRACSLKDRHSGPLQWHLIVTDPGLKVPAHVLVNAHSHCRTEEHRNVNMMATCHEYTIKWLYWGTFDRRRKKKIINASLTRALLAKFSVTPEVTLTSDIYIRHWFSDRKAVMWWIVKMKKKNKTNTWKLQCSLCWEKMFNEHLKSLTLSSPVSKHPHVHFMATTSCKDFKNLL